MFVTDLKYSWKFFFESSLIKGSNFDDKASNSTARFCLMRLFLSVKLWCKHCSFISWQGVLHGHS